MGIFDIFNRDQEEKYKGVTLDSSLDKASQRQLIDRGRASEIPGLKPVQTPGFLEEMESTVSGVKNFLGNAKDKIANINIPEVSSDIAGSINQKSQELYGDTAVNVLTDTILPAMTKPFGTSFKHIGTTNLEKALEPASKILLDKTLNTKIGRGVVGKIGEYTQDIPLKFLAAEETLRTGESWDKIYKEYKAVSYDQNNPVWVKFLAQLQSSAPQTLLGTAMSFVPYVGKPLAYSYWGALSADEQIKNKGSVDSIGNIAIDTIGDSILGSSLEGLFKKQSKIAMAEILKSANIEGATEVAQSLLKYGNDFRNAKTTEQRNKILTDAKQYITSGQIAMEYAVGATTGGMIAGGAKLFTPGSQIGEFNVSTAQVPKQGGAIVPEEEKEAINSFAEGRLQELNNKANGFKALDEQGRNITVEAQILTYPEIQELKFLNENKGNPENIVSAYTIITPSSNSQADQLIFQEAVDGVKLEQGETPDIIQQAIDQASKDVIPASQLQTIQPEDHEVYHQTPADVEMIKDSGFIPGKNSAFGEAAFFAKQPNPMYGENQISEKTSRYKFRTFETVKEQQDYIAKWGGKKLADAVRNEGKFDGFIIPQPGGNNIYGLTNTDKLNKNLNIKQFVTTEQAKRQSRSFPFIEKMDIPVVAKDKILTPEGKLAFGKYANGMIEFLNNPHKTTVPHEAVHAYLDLMLTPEQKQVVINEAKRRFAGAIVTAKKTGSYKNASVKGLSDDAIAEEILAEDMIKYAKTGEAASSKLKQFYDKFIQYIKNMLGGKNIDVIEKFYKDIQSTPGYFQRQYAARRIAGADGLNALRQEFMQDPEALTSRILKNVDVANRVTASYAYMTQVMSSLAPDKGKGIKKPEWDLVNDVLQTSQFKDNPKINMDDFRAAIKAELMPLSIITSSTYATYGNNNVGLDDAKATTYLFNSPFEHGKTGHFSSDFNKNLKAEDVEIKNIPVQEGNTKEQFAVVRKGVILTEENIQENVIQVADSEEAAQQWIEDHKENIAPITSGLFAHIRTFDEILEKTPLTEAIEQVDILEAGIDNDLKYLENIDATIKDTQDNADAIAKFNNVAFEEYLKDNPGTNSKFSGNPKQLSFNKFDNDDFLVTKSWIPALNTVEMRNGRFDLEATLVKLEQLRRTIAEGYRTTLETLAEKKQFIEEQKNKPVEFEEKISHIAEIQSDVYQADRLQSNEANIVDAEEALSYEKKQLESSVRYAAETKAAKKKELDTMNEVQRIFLKKKWSKADYQEMINATHTSSDAVIEMRGKLEKKYKTTPEAIIKLEAYLSAFDRGTDEEASARIIERGILDDVLRAEEVYKEFDNRGYQSDEVRRNEQSVKNAEDRLTKLKERGANIPKIEKQFFAFKNTWHERSIREIIRLKAMEGFTKLRFPTPYTVSLVEGYVQGDNEDGDYAPYEVLSANDESELVVGDTIDYDGTTLEVVHVDGNEITVAPENASRTFSHNDTVEEEVNDRMGDLRSEWDDLEKEFGTIDTPAKAQNVLDKLDIANGLATYKTKEINIEREQKLLEDQLILPLESLKIHQDKVAMYKKFKTLIEGGIIEREQLTIDNLTMAKKDSLEAQYGVPHAYWNYIPSNWRGENGTDKENYKRVADLTIIDANRGIDGALPVVASAEDNIADIKRRSADRIEKLKAIKSPTPAQLKGIPAKILESNHGYYLENADRILTEMANEYEDGTFEFDDYEDKMREFFAESANEMDYKDIYGEDKVFISEDRYGDAQVTVIDEGAYVENFMQPNYYEDRPTYTPETFDYKEHLSGNNATVAAYYDKQVIPYLKKIRKENLRLVTDDTDGRNTTWWETDIMPEDREAVEAFQTGSDINEPTTRSGKQVAKYVNEIETSKEDGEPLDDYLRKVISDNESFTLQTVKIKDILKSDSDVRDYVTAGENRYNNDQEAEDEQHLPIVIGSWGDGTHGVLDGYNRILNKVQQGEKNIEAWVAEPITDRVNTADVPKFQEMTDEQRLKAEIRRGETMDNMANDEFQSDMEILAARDLNLAYADSEMENGYQNFKKLATLKPKMLEVGTDDGALKKMLPNVNVDYRFFEGGKTIDQHDQLQMFKERFAQEAEAKERAKYLTSTELGYRNKNVAQKIVKAARKGKNVTLRNAMNIARGIERPITITNKASTLLKARLRDMARAAKAGASFGRAEMRADLNLAFAAKLYDLKSMRKAIAAYSQGLPAEQRGSMLNAVATAKTGLDMIKAYARIDAAIKVANKKEQLQKVGKMAKLVKKAMKSGNGIAVDYQKKIADILMGYNLKNPTQATIDKLKGLAEYIDNNPDTNIPDYLIKKLNTMSRKTPKEMTTEELEGLNDMLLHLWHLGELKMKMKVKYDERVRQEMVTRLMATTQSIEKSKLGLLAFFHSPRVADLMDGMRRYKGENVKLVKKISLTASKAVRNAEVIVEDTVAKISALKEEFTAEEQAIMAFQMAKDQKLFTQAQSLLSAYADEYGWKSEADLKMTPEMQYAIDTLRGTFAETVDYLGAVYEEIENKPFIKGENYFPNKYDKTFDSTIDIEAPTINEMIAFQGKQTNQGFTFARVKGVKKVLRTDIFNVFAEAVAEQQYYMMVQPVLNETASLVSDRGYQKALGAPGVEWWDRYLKAVANKGRSLNRGIFEKTLKQLRLNISKAVLGYKATSAIVQPTAIVDAYAYVYLNHGVIPANALLLRLAATLTVPGYAKGITSRSLALQLRKGGEQAIAELSIDKTGTRVGRAYVKAGMGLLRALDIRTASAVQQTMYKHFLAKGMSKEEASTEADFVMNLTQGSSENGDMPLVLMEGELGRTFLTFQTFVLNRWGIIAHDIIRSGIINGTIPRKFKGIIALLLLSIAGGVENVLRTTVNNAITGNDYPEKFNFLAQSLLMTPEAVPVVGGILTSQIEYGQAGSFPLQRVTSNVIKGATDFLNPAGATEETKTKNRTKGAITLVEAIGSIAGVTGSAQMADVVQRIVVPPEPSVKKKNTTPARPARPERPKRQKRPARPSR